MLDAQLSFCHALTFDLAVIGDEEESTATRRMILLVVACSGDRAEELTA